MTEELNLTQAGRILKNKIDRSHRQRDNFASKQMWEKCIECDGAIEALNYVWINFASLDLLHKD